MPKTTIVTAIPYVNSNPHIGNLLTTLCGDVQARYERQRGHDVFFVAGTDENGLKILEAAQAQNRPVEPFVAEIAGRIEEVFRAMGIEYDAFVRTSLPAHREASQEFFRRLEANGHVYKAKYEGWYDVSTETYFKEAELVDGRSPDGNEVRWVSEENWFFRLSAFEAPLIRHIEENPGFIVPESRRNEVLAFLRGGLRDQCISRQNPGWGIPVPGDEGQVIYVWFDALINYITATGWPADGWQDKWPPLVQFLGKDILTRFHATLWPAMLMGIGEPLPRHLAAHAWVLFGGDKMSKSRGNVVLPRELAEETAARTGASPELAVDAVRWYLVATMGYENDTIFTPAEFDRRYNADLANDLGNALNRTLAMAHRFGGGVAPEGEIEGDALAAIVAAKDAVAAAFDAFRLDRAAEAALGLVRYLNKAVDDWKPWALAKAGDARLGGVLRTMLTVMRAAEGLVAPFVPATARAIAGQLGREPVSRWEEIGGPFPAGTKLAEPRPLFPRLEVEKPLPKGDKPPKSEKPPKEEKTVEPIGIEEFAKVQLRVARILEAEPVAGSDKLLKLQVVVGTERRQIVAGIRKAYSAEDLIGRQVVVVANLKPATLRGETSQGMLLAATDGEGNAILLEPDREAPEGATVR